MIHYNLACSRRSGGIADHCNPAPHVTQLGIKMAENTSLIAQIIRLYDQYDPRLKISRHLAILGCERDHQCDQRDPTKMHRRAETIDGYGTQN